MVKQIVDQLGGWFNVVAAVTISGLICAVWMSDGIWPEFIRDNLIWTIPAVVPLSILCGSSNVVSALIISGLICSVWGRHHGGDGLGNYEIGIGLIQDTIICTLPIVAVLVGLERVKIRGKTMKILSRSAAIVVTLLMAVVWNLHEAEVVETKRKVGKIVKEYVPSEDSCRAICDSKYAFSIYKPGTWHIGENTWLEGCHCVCRSGTG